MLRLRWRGSRQRSGICAIVGRTVTQNDPTSGDPPSSFQVEVLLSEASRNRLQLEGLCRLNKGPIEFVTPATAFQTMGPYTCIPEQSAVCSSVVVTWSNDVGSLNGPTLSFTSTATLGGCGQTDTVSVAFTNGVRTTP